MKTLSILALLLLPLVAKADIGVYDVEIDNIWVFAKDSPSSYVGKAEVALKGSPIQLSGCLSNSLIIHTDKAVDPNGPTLMATVLGAQLSGKQIRINVTNDSTILGRCVIRYLTMRG